MVTTHAHGHSTLSLYTQPAKHDCRSNCGTVVNSLHFQNLLIFIMLKLFSKYAIIGVLNTIIHWVVFAVCVYGLDAGQALANFGGFVVAVSFSFFANARFTFKSSSTTLRYMLYVGFMGTLSAAIGWEADKVGLPPLVTLVIFSAISLVCGFIYSKFIVFRDTK